jgi:lipopolysaccharide transport system ATP-binding protein
MEPPVIRIQNLSKLYRLGEVGTGSLAHDINRWWHRVRGREDPYAQVGRVNDRTQRAESDWVWALKDINFEVRRGEVLGIIGRNGAGKSTLLKILSRVTAPTGGEIRVKGRIASLLEVGTGFHPELTGRENIYLNGSILGMRKKEIDRKLDEIVDFSGCAAYLDTPVKRYSSGMQVRLAFAVAAHLDPEILIVDEVLAVGDAEFQTKCLGKMREHSADAGRTILFVTHDLKAIESLCPRALLMDRGTIIQDGATHQVLRTYRREAGHAEKWNVHLAKRGASLDAAECSYQVLDSGEARMRFCIRIALDIVPVDLFVDIALETESSVRVVQHMSSHYYPAARVTRRSVASFLFETGSPPLLPGEYFLTVYAYERLGAPLLHLSRVFAFKVSHGPGKRELGSPGYTALICPDFTLKVTTN